MPSNIGPLGFPRFTSAGPLVLSKEEFSQAVEKDEFGNLILEQLGELGIPREDPSEEQQMEVTGEVITQIYPTDTPVDRAKRHRLAACMTNTWAERWAEGLAESTQTANTDDELEMLKLKLKGCVGITESNVPDDPRLLPDRFK